MEFNFVMDQTQKISLGVAVELLYCLPPICRFCTLVFSSTGFFFFIFLSYFFSSLRAQCAEMANWRNTKKQLYTGSQTYEKIYDRNLKQIQLKNAVYRCGELEENKWQTGGRPHTHSRTKCNFVSLVDDNIKLTSWAYQLCAPLSNFNEKCWQNQPQKFN